MKLSNVCENYLNDLLTLLIIRDRLTELGAQGKNILGAPYLAMHEELIVEKGRSASRYMYCGNVGTFQSIINLKTKKK